MVLFTVNALLSTTDRHRDFSKKCAPGGRILVYFSRESIRESGEISTNIPKIPNNPPNRGVVTVDVNYVVAFPAYYRALLFSLRAARWGRSTGGRAQSARCDRAVGWRVLVDDLNAPAIAMQDL